MKRLDKLLALCGVLAVVSVATGVITGTEEKKEKIKNTDAVILSVESEDVEALSWEYDDTSLSYHRDGEDWVWDEDEAFPVDSEKIDTLLSTFESFGASFIIEEPEETAVYGLDEPVCTIKVQTEEQSYEIVLGDYSLMDEERYVEIGDGNVYLVSSDPYEVFSIELSDTIKNDELPSFTHIHSVSFSGEENYSITYDDSATLSICEDDFYFTQTDEKVLPLDSYRVEDYCADITLLSQAEYVSYAVTEEELSAWGLAEPELTVTVCYADDAEDGEGKGEEKSFTLSLGRNQEELAEKEETEAEGKEYKGTVSSYLRIGDSPIIYSLSEEGYNSLRAASVNDLRHKEVFTADFDSVTGVDITLDGESYALTLSEDAEEEDTFLLADEEVDGGAVRSKLEALSITEFSEEYPAEDAVLELSLTLTLENENYPSWKLELYRWDGSTCLARVDGESLGFVSRSSVVALQEAINAIVLG